MDDGLTAYWIVSPLRHAPIGFGVTARSLDDALAIIRAMDCGRYLPDDVGTIRVTANVRFEDLDRGHIALNIGPMASRGMWYPFVALGVPRWAEQRMT